MEKKYYTSEKNVQIVISLLKAHGIKRVIVSPGTTNMTFVGSIQQDSWFEIYSSVDERSAAYLACGMAEESGEPVVLSCTGATASRNYMPGLTEAFYRKLPVLAITSHRGEYAIGHLLDQQIDRRNIPNDIVNVSVTVPMVDTFDDEKMCIIEANKAILALSHHGGGPAHINLYTRYSKDFSIKELPIVRVINRYVSDKEKLPEIKSERVAIFIGSHSRFNEKVTELIDKFCQCYNAFVICDHTSGYKGNYGVYFSLIGGQNTFVSSFKNIDLLIHLGEVSGDAFGRSLNVARVWRVCEDGALRDSFNKLTNVFEMSELDFFHYYTNGKDTINVSRYNACISEYNQIYNSIQELPFGNLWIAKQICSQLPKNSVLHLGILNSLRSWNFFEIDKSINTNSNVGGFGIDGGLSSLIGASMVNKDKIYFGVFGDLAFFYDMNVVGNRHVGNNVRILLINNGKGNEFRLSMHPCNIFGNAADDFMAASGHFGNKSIDLVKHYSSDLGFMYFSASNKKEFLQHSEYFLKSDIGSKPIIFEVFTDMENETLALDQVLSTMVDPKLKLRKQAIDLIKQTPIISSIISKK